MNKTNVFIGGIVLSVALAMGGLVWNGPADAQTVSIKDAVNPADVTLFGAYVQFIGDGGCSIRVDHKHVPADAEDLAVNPPANEYPYGTVAACNAFKVRAAKATLADYRKDGGS